MPEVRSIIRIRLTLKHLHKVPEILKHAEDAGRVCGQICENLLHRVHEAVNPSRVTARSGAPAQRITKSVRVGHTGIGIRAKREQFRNHHEQGTGRIRDGFPSTSLSQVASDNLRKLQPPCDRASEFEEESFEAVQSLPS